MSHSLSLPVAVLLLAGCLAAPSADPIQPDAPIDDGIPSFLELDHDHNDASLHEDASGFSLAAYLPICAASAPCSFGEIDVMGEILIQAIMEPDGGFALVDIKTPTSPRLLSTTTFGRAVATDVKLSPDAKTAFVAVSNWAPLVGKAGLQQDPTSASGLARSQGVQVYDISDPRVPVARWFEPIGVEGVHMVDVHVIDGALYVVVTTPAYFKFYAANVQGTTTEPVWIGRYDPMVGRLVHVADYSPPEVVEAAPVSGAGSYSAHDITIIDDPDEGPIMFGAYGFGVAVASLKDPASPRHLGSWSLVEAGFDPAVHNTHTVMVQRVDGRRTVVIAPEQIENNTLYVVDAQDLSQMALLGTWSLPGDLENYRGVMWSLHNVNLLDGTAYVAHYHGGVWALDVSTPDALRAPRIRGYFSTVETGNVGPGLPEVWAGPTAPNAWDVIPGKGVVFVSDITSGLYVLDAQWEIPQTLPYGARGAQPTAP